jgi:hypothetical protein
MKTYNSRGNFLLLHLNHIYKITNRINVRTMYSDHALPRKKNSRMIAHAYFYRRVGVSVCYFIEGI